MPELASFSLVGGTALSLVFGHRISVDLDLFSIGSVDQEQVLKGLQVQFGNSLDYKGNYKQFGIFCFVENVKVDLVPYIHPLIRPIQVIDGIRMFSLEDIAAMKIQAILGRGKKKDFWDIAELFKHFKLKEIIAFYKEKFPSQMLLISIPQALSYFDDADESEDPISINGMDWDAVKDVIRTNVSEYLK
ncbi:MAG TPA: nucleotidyl transferase AbiEii/AbiGii toxin family protein [Saprospiraceae bacterium]|jgi:predicted nucleotidyltransferase component of viral defense system|nr:nucleotidyl transferase AbiEii/AbiGii toxin family protein [Saprospiraceae bacterium]